jgi:hypothetical protein
VQQGVVALVLLAGGLLLLGGLLSSLDLDQVDGLDLWETSSGPTSVESGAGSEGTEDLQQMAQAMGFESIAGDHDIEIHVPAGSTMQWTDNGIQVQGNVTLVIPEGTAFENLTILLPEDTVLLLAPGSRAGTQILHLGDETRIHLPKRLDVPALLLPDGGELSEHQISLREQRQGVNQNNLTTPGPSLLETPRAVLEEPWRVNMQSGEHHQIPGLTGFLDAIDIEPDTPYTNQTLTIPTGSAPGTQEPPVQDSEGPPSAGTHVSGPTKAPPWWAWALLALVLLALAAVTTAKQLPFILRRSPPPFTMRVRLNQRPHGLSLALQEAQPGILGLEIEHHKQTPIRDDGPPQLTLSLRLQGHGIIYKQNVQSEAQVALPSLSTGDHSLEVKIQNAWWRRPHRFTYTLRVDTWSNHVARDYQDLVDAMRTHDAHLPPGATPRQVAARLANLLPEVDRQGNAHLVKTFEQANYSETEIAEDQWLAFARTTHARMTALLARRHHKPTRRKPTQGSPRATSA